MASVKMMHVPGAAGIGTTEGCSSCERSRSKGSGRLDLWPAQTAGQAEHDAAKCCALTPGDAAESAAVAVGILELPRDGDEAVAHLAALVVVEAVAAARVRAAVQGGAGVARRHVRVHIDVVEPEASAAELLEDGHDGRVGHEVAVRPVPVQHAAARVAEVLQPARAPAVRRGCTPLRKTREEEQAHDDGPLFSTPLASALSSWICSSVSSPGRTM